MYTRETELRHMKSNDVYKLGVILDDNNFWKKLMEIIPKELNAQECSGNGALDWEEAITRGFKYNNDHIRLIENAIKRGDTRLFTEILFDEWSTSGRKSERPTLGVLLQLLVKADLFRAADFVAIEFLNEAPPERPSNGPGRRISITIPSEAFIDIEDVVNDTAFYPSTGALNDNANYEISLADNKDYFNKYHKKDKIIIMHDNNVPVPPPRTQRLARLSQQQQQRQQQEQQKLENTNEATTAEAESNRVCLGEQQQVSAENDLPKFSQIMTSNHNISNIQSANAIGIETNTNTSDCSQSTESTNLSEAPIPMISILNISKNVTQPETRKSGTEPSDILPVISALNLNGERNGSDLDNLNSSESQSQNESSLSFDASNILENIAENGESDIDDNEVNYEDDDDEQDDDDDDSSVPNLSIFDQRSSNNDSSLTNVTGTSGENSFELSINECSSASNENIAGVQKS